MEHFVTLFDSGFLPQGLALHSSLQQLGDPFTLWIVCVDDTLKQSLESLCLKNTRLISLADVEREFPELLTIKASRQRGEYCWTLTPFSIKMTFRLSPDIQRITYLDADLFICNSLMPIFEELNSSGASVLITEHDYLPEYDMSKQSGVYCVQFVPFNNKPDAHKVLDWWAEKCIEWCYARQEPGKFGDQMYLDEWPTLFGTSIYTLSQKCLAQAPWNCRKYPADSASFFHMHSLRLFKGGKVRLYQGYKLPRSHINSIYQTYLQSLKTGQITLEKTGIQLEFPNLEFSFRARARQIKERLAGREKWASIK